MALLPQIIVLLAATLCFVPLAKCYTQNTVLGYLIAGLLLGAGGFNLIHDAELIAQLTELGMLLLMGFLGFCFRPQQLWQRRHQLLLDSGLGFVILALLLTGISFLLLEDLLFAALTGLALSFSSVNLIQQILQQQQKTKDRLGQAALGQLQFQVLLAVLLIALFPLLEDTASTRHGIAYFAAIIATISGLFLASRYLIRPAFHFLGRYRSTELVVVLSALIILCVMWLMDILNIHPLIGAFLAGLLLAESEFKAELERITQPIQHTAIGVFFLAVGLSLSFEPLWQATGIIAGSVLALILIKFGVLTAIQLYRQGRDSHPFLLAILLAQGGELGLILLKIAGNEQLLPVSLLDSTLLVICLSMLCTPAVYALCNSSIIPYLRKKVPVALPDIPSQPILIAGFGRFGQVIARVLHAQGKTFSIIDNQQPDADFIRQYGHDFIDADVSKVENLRAAGLEYCKLLVIAIDDVEDCMNLSRYLRLNYPEIILWVRARDRHHAHLLHRLGVQRVWRETYFSALDLAQHLLVETGMDTETALSRIQQFQHEDQKLLAQQYGVLDQDDVVESYPDALAELEYLFENIQIHCDRPAQQDSSTS